MNIYMVMQFLFDLYILLNSTFRKIIPCCLFLSPTCYPAVVGRCAWES